MDDIWKRKLLAFLADPPHPPARVQGYEELRAAFLGRCGLGEESARELERSSNAWQAAAADRFLFPDPARAGWRVDWGASWCEFRHPLGGARLTPSAFAPAAGIADDKKRTGALDGAALEGADWKRKFILAWRLWPEHVARAGSAHLACLAADPRIPDHTLWHDGALAAAFTACAGRPAFLLFEIGPVPEFLASARTTGDVWSASYLLSFLIAQAMLAITDGTQVEGIGPDAIVFPHLRGQPLVHYHWWKQGYLGDEKLRASDPIDLLTPSLPNRFLALVPAQRADELARAAEDAVRRTWHDIAENVKAMLASQSTKASPGWEQRWDAQVKQFPVADWVVHPWADPAAALAEGARGTPPLLGGWDKHPLSLALRWAEELIPPRERESPGARSCAGFAWPLHLAMTEWKFAARKHARNFAAWECPQPAGGLPRHGALSEIHRLWPEAYLRGALRWDICRPASLNAVSDEAPEPCHAIVAMNADDMGQWVSGVKAAPWVNSLAAQAGDYFRKHWPAKASPAAADVPRPFSPGVHAALSEALTNFSLYCARPIVEAFGGQLLHVGGDDVLAMTPAAAALDCAQALQLAFRGLHPDAPEAHASSKVKEVLESLFDYSRHADGFLTVCTDDSLGNLKPVWPLMVMGPLATLSAGIAVGHVRSPMPDLMQAACEAGEDAKRVPGKGAFCLRVMKRLGEAVGFTARWGDSVIAVWDTLQGRSFGEHVTRLYAARVKALLLTDGASYTESWDEVLQEAVAAEWEYVLHRAAGLPTGEARELSAFMCGTLATALSPRDFLHFWVTWAFVTRPTEPTPQSGP